MLADIELAQTLKSETEKAQEEMVETVPHPQDQDYNSLNCRLLLLDKDTETFKVWCCQGPVSTKVLFYNDLLFLMYPLQQSVLFH